MNNYIRIVMQPTPDGLGGSFNAFASFTLDNINAPFQNVRVKIDTGCSISTIPLAKFKHLTNKLKILKENDIKAGVDYKTSYGVESGGKKHKIPVTDEDKLNCEALKFKHSINNLNINGVTIKYNNIYVNYDRASNILIGVDILKDWDIHIGTIDTGETIFLGCPKTQINDDYLQELEKTFHIASDINAFFIRQKIHK